MVTILYGCGELYQGNKEKIFKKYKIDYICDQKLDNLEVSIYDGIPVIKTVDAYKKKNITVILCVYNIETINEIKKCFIKREEIKFIFFRAVITGRELLEDFPEGVYEDFLGNVINFDKTLPQSIRIAIMGDDNKLVLGSNIEAGNKLSINMGRKGFVSIGDKTTFGSASIDCAWGKVEIGSDCMFSWDVHIRNDDGHHIFDMVTGERLNRCGNLIIGNHCWIGEGCLLLKNINIGDGCVIGGKSVVTKSIPCNTIAAGNPAKIVKRGVNWERNWTKTEDIDNLNDLRKV